MAGAANIHKSWPGKTSQSYFPLRLGGYAGFNTGDATIDVCPVPFDCYIREVWLTSKEFVIAGTNLTLATVDSTALTIVATISAVTDIENTQQTLHADVAGDIEILHGDGFITTVTGDADSQLMIMWTLMLEAIR